MENSHTAGKSTRRRLALKYKGSTTREEWHRRYNQELSKTRKERKNLDLCSSCGGKREDRRLALCNACRAKAKAVIAERKNNGLCVKCGQDSAKPNRSYCKKCAAKARLKKTGIRKEDWQKVYEAIDAFGQRCECCGTNYCGNKHDWALDHDHETGEFRGVLCHPCNLILGFAKDSVNRLDLAIAYLNRTTKQQHEIVCESNSYW